LKKFVVIALAVFTLSGTALVYPVYQYFLSEVKLQAQLLTHSSLPSEQLVSIRIAKKDANQKNGFKQTGTDEIQFHGQMYDVVSSSQQGDMMIFQCISDHNEDVLNNVFSQVLNLNTDHSNLPNNNQKLLIQNCIKEFLVCKQLRAHHTTYSLVFFTPQDFPVALSTFSDVLYSPPKA